MARRIGEEHGAKVTGRLLARRKSTSNSLFTLTVMEWSNGPLLAKRQRAPMLHWVQEGTPFGWPPWETLPESRFLDFSWRQRTSSETVPATG